jgi:hypothetical protein
LLSDGVADVPKNMKKCLVGLHKCVLVALNNMKVGKPAHNLSGTDVQSSLDHQHNINEVAAGMVFGIGIIRKVMGKHPHRVDVLNLSVRRLFN